MCEWREIECCNIGCDVPGCRRGSERHHIQPRGAGGQDDEDNIMHLCRKHHIEIHQIGKETFFKKYKLDNPEKLHTCGECGAKIEKYRICGTCGTVLCYDCYFRHSKHYLGGCGWDRS